MAIKTCATPMGRALAGVLSFLIIGVASNSISYAYTVDDLREFTGFGRKDTLENKAELSSIIYRYGEQVKNQTIIDSINNNDVYEDVLKGYEDTLATLTELNGEIDEALNSKSALEIISLYREADTVNRKLKKYNLSDIYYRSKDGQLTESDYNYAVNELTKANEVYQLGDIGSNLTECFGHNRFSIIQPYGDTLDDSGLGNVVHSNGLYIRVSDENSEVKSLWDGIVEKVVDSEEWGKYIVIRHGDNLTSSISFLSEVDKMPGDVVKQYDTIGKASDKIYLEIILDGLYVDPMYVLGDSGKRAYFDWASKYSERIVGNINYDSVQEKIDTFQDENLDKNEQLGENDIQTQLLE